MKSELLHRFAVGVLPPAVGILIKLWLGTCKVQVHGETYRNETLDVDRATIVSFWHYGMLVIFHQLRSFSGVIMASASRDGDYIAGLANFFGFSVARGSRNKSGVQALKDLIRAARAGKNTGIVADGSQGPPFIAQPGAILLASRTGLPILPMAWSASSYLAAKSWDRTAIPKPFSQLDVCYGEPLIVPPGLKNEEIENYRQILEQRLNALYKEAWRLQNLEAH